MNRALFVTCSSSTGSTSPALSGTTNDAILLSRLLVRKYDFHDLYHLREEAATVDNVGKALNEMVSRAGPGDDVLFYYSGHGSVIPDLGKDEVDMYDECLVLHDHHIDNAFTDDKLYEAIKPLHPEAYLTVILDTCHAGGMLDSDKPIYSKHNPIDGYDPNVEYSVGNTKKIGKKFSNKGPSAQRHVLYCSCPEGGLAGEEVITVRHKNKANPIKLGFGIFTRALVRTLRTKLWDDSWGLVHRSVSNSVLKRTSGAQTPMLYGNAGLMQRGPFGSKTARDEQEQSR